MHELQERSLKKRFKEMLGEGRMTGKSLANKKSSGMKKLSPRECLHLLIVLQNQDISQIYYFLGPGFPA